LNLPHASHEQFPPSELLLYVRQVEDAGFQAIMTSDHITPWSERQGNSGNNSAWLGASLATTSLPFGSLAIPCGWRYHPVVLTHMVATIAEMFPDRLPLIAAGSGEAMNEHVVGRRWPLKPERNDRLISGCEIIRRLLKGESVTDANPWFATEAARLWTLPSRPPVILGAALSPETAGWMGSWAGGLITVHKPKNELSEMVAQFEFGGGSDSPIAVQLQISWGRTEDEARHAAWDQWRVAAADPDCLANLRTPAEFDRKTAEVEPQEMDNVIPLVTSGQSLLDLIADCRGCGVDEIYIHNVSRDQTGFMRFMAREVLPAVATTQ
jgi:coenzyme F420-dependent glucose-6-phosphate dehydrogenase